MFFSAWLCRQSHLPYSVHRKFHLPVQLERDSNLTLRSAARCCRHFCRGPLLSSRRPSTEDHANKDFSLRPLIQKQAWKQPMSVSTFVLMITHLTHLVENSRCARGQHHTCHSYIDIFCNVPQEARMKAARRKCRQSRSIESDS